jgi:dipeptidyl aminopeptidase/acylaminoacyl peptidase
MRSIDYKASDGASIPGYLTLPQGTSDKNLPLVVLPHGGPALRDHKRFDFLRLFLANRGYAVLQMNFRGSSGFGSKWRDDARQDWGGLTYSDIVDGTRWAVEQGFADPRRICIVGWSFGGYAALVGAVRNPDLFRCSASIAGVSDLTRFRSTVSRGAGDQVADTLLGNDEDQLSEDSPAKQANQIDIPVLLIHGSLDTKAPIRQSKVMAAALKKADKDHKFVTLEQGTHYLWRESEKTTLLTELEQFLKQNIGSGETAPNGELNSKEQ